MANVFGESGRYVSDEATRQRRRIQSLVLILIAVFGAIEGFVLSLFFHPASFSPPLNSLILIVVMLLMMLVCKCGNRNLSALEKREKNYRRGADGEKKVGLALARFPDDFHVINDLATPFGNLDHVVVGPTGVFVMDTKNWRGAVSADGKGELLTNGKATEKRCIRQFTARMLGIRDKVKLLAPGLDPFYHGIFVFPSARVQAKWGTTGNVNCITDDQLHKYIVEQDFGKRLQKDEVDRIARAFLSLAQMDVGFTENSPRRLALRQVINAAV